MCFNAGLPFFNRYNMKSIIRTTFILLASAALAACGPSYDEIKKQTQAEQQRLAREDSMALKVGVLPTLDCLPIYVAKERQLFDTAKADIRLRTYMSQIDCDEALKRGRIEGNATDIVRGQHMRKKGYDIEYVAATNSYWQLISNRMARIRRINQLSDKMVAMTRYSATDLLADLAVDSARLKPEEVFKVQINDVGIRLHMLLNNEMDAMLLTEPQATTARLYKNPVLMDSRKKDMHFGVIAFNGKVTDDKNRKIQIQTFIDGYNAACDSINKNGLKHYADILKKYYKIDDKTLNALPKMRYEHAKAPRKQDIETADKWLKNK